MFIAGLLPRVATAVPLSVALKQGTRTLRYAELWGAASRLARALAARGVKRGDRVALLGHPGIDLVVAEHAAVALGAIPVGAYAVLAPPEIHDVIRDAAPAAIVFDPAFENVLDCLPASER